MLPGDWMYTTRALAVVVLPGEGDKNTEQYLVLDALTELNLLAESLGMMIVAHTHKRKPKTQSRTFFGRGSLEQIRDLAKSCDVQIIIFDCELSYQRSRNISKAIGEGFQIKDRTELILDIFAEHAKSSEGRLQVDEALTQHRLASLREEQRKKTKQMGRPTGQWVALTEGETQRKHLLQRLRNTRMHLDRVKQQRLVRRRRREAHGLETIVLVGYTNTGKSTLFNSLTEASVSTSARMFETVDPTVRLIRLPSRREALLVDTVGLIRNTPEIVLSGFSASLEELRSASVIVRITDVSDPASSEHDQHVDHVIHQLGATSIPQVRVFNKIDRISISLLEQLESESPIETAYVSAKLKRGLNDLLERIDFKLTRDSLTQIKIRLPYTEVAAAIEVSARGRIFSVTYRDRYAEYDLQVTTSLAVKLRKFTVEDTSFLGNL